MISSHATYNRYATRYQMSKKSTTDQEEAKLWEQFVSPDSEVEYDLQNPEILNALAAYADGREDDPARERIERLLLGSDLALDDLAFLREMEAADSVEIPAAIMQRARSLVGEDSPQPATEQRPSDLYADMSDTGTPTVAVHGWSTGVILACMLCVSLAGFMLGIGTQNQQMVADQLILSEFNASLNYGSAAAMTPLGGGL
jgi:anti-sigma factor RsiW